MTQIRGRPRIWVRLGCAGCSVPLLALAAAVAVVVLILTGCSSGSTSAPSAAPAGANALVCRHYLAQRAWVKNLTYPTLADALKFAGYVGADDGQAQAGTKLRHDLDAMVTAIQDHKADYAASLLVYHDCA